MVAPPQSFELKSIGLIARVIAERLERRLALDDYSVSRSGCVEEERWRGGERSLVLSDRPTVLLDGRERQIGSHCNSSGNEPQGSRTQGKWRCTTTAADASAAMRFLMMRVRVRCLVKTSTVNVILASRQSCERRIVDRAGRREGGQFRDERENNRERDANQTDSYARGHVKR